MPPVDRKNPKRAKSSDSRVSFMEFMREFADDDACLDHLWRTRYAEDGEHAHCPKCDRQRAFKKYATKQQRQSWTCTACGHHIHPTAGTIFHKSSTSLHLWFYAIYLVSSSRCGIAAKQLEREIGVNYKTALRMLHLIREQLMQQNYQGPLSGEIEADETWVGGKEHEGAKAKRRRENPDGPKFRPYVKPRPLLFGMVERQGQIRAQVMPDRYGYRLRSEIASHVLPASMVFTDDWAGYNGLGQRYGHRRINHSQRIYVDGDTHTNTIEGFFGHFKTDVRGTHHHISTRWLPGYLIPHPARQRGSRASLDSRPLAWSRSRVSGFQVHRLFGSFLKVGRSIQHLSELNESIQGWGEANFHRHIAFYGEPNDQRSKYFIKAHIRAPSPVLTWGLSVGDIVYALRSSLDQVTYNLSSDPSRATEFPICRTKKDWVTRSPAMLWGIDPKFIALIDEAQPYHRGDSAHKHQLALLGELSNIDKHRTIPVVGLVPSGGNVRIKRTVGLASHGKFRIKRGVVMDEGAIVAEASITPDGSGKDPEMDVDVALAFDLAFGRNDIPSALHAKPVLGAFAELLGPFVSALIARIAEADGLTITTTPLDPETGGAMSYRF